MLDRVTLVFLAACAMQAMHAAGRRQDRQDRRIQRLLKEKKNDAEVVDEFFLTALARFRKEAEKKKMLEYLAAEKNGRE